MIWVLMYWHDDDCTEVCGVFSTMDLAAKAAEEISISGLVDDLEHGEFRAHVMDVDVTYAAAPGILIGGYPRR